jgi:hypothetical protein
MRLYELDGADDPIAIYDIPNVHYDDGGTVKIYRDGNGYYGDTNDFDFSRPDLPSLVATLKKWGYVKHVFGEDLLGMSQ